MEVRQELAKKGIQHLQYLNVGGGIGVNYNARPPGFQEFFSSKSTSSGLIDHPPEAQSAPDVPIFLQKLSEVIPKGIKVIIEPGRSLVSTVQVPEMLLLLQKCKYD